MSEVQKFCEYIDMVYGKDSFGPVKDCPSIFEPGKSKFVLDADFDRVTAERDAALRQLEAESQGADRAAVAMMEWRRDYMDLQQRLTAADELNDTIKAELSERDSLLRIVRDGNGYLEDHEWDRINSILINAERTHSVRISHFLLLMDIARELRDPSHVGWEDLLASRIDAALKPSDEKKTDPRVVDALREAGYLRND